MPAGQSYGVFKLVQKSVQAGCQSIGVSSKTAKDIGTGAGTYVGGWTAIITVDPAGGAGIATEVAARITKKD